MSAVTMWVMGTLEKKASAVEKGAHLARECLKRHLECLGLDHEERVGRLHHGKGKGTDNFLKLAAEAVAFRRALGNPLAYRANEPKVRGLGSGNAKGEEFPMKRCAAAGNRLDVASAPDPVRAGEHGATRLIERGPSCDVARAFFGLRAFAAAHESRAGACACGYGAERSV